MIKNGPEDRSYVRELMKDRARLDAVVKAALDGDSEAHEIIALATDEFNKGAEVAAASGRLVRMTKPSAPASAEPTQKAQTGAQETTLEKRIGQEITKRGLTVASVRPSPGSQHAVMDFDMEDALKRRDSAPTTKGADAPKEIVMNVQKNEQGQPYVVIARNASVEDLKQVLVAKLMTPANVPRRSRGTPRNPVISA